MKSAPSRLLPILLGCALLATPGLAPALAADDEQAAPAETRTPSPSAARIAAIPAHTITTERTIAVPPKREKRRIARYETVREPIVEQRRVPVYGEREVPVYETVDVPVYRTERVPVWGEKQVTTYKHVRKPVTIELWNPFACENECVELWDTCEKVPNGTQTVKAIVAHEERRVADGTRLERKQVGVRTETVITGYRTEEVTVGERERRVCVGHDETWVVVEPARQRRVTECTDVPCERVTVVPDDATRTTPLAGTARVLTESQYAETLAAIR